MNNFEEGNIITLNDDKDYIIVNKVEFQGNSYLNLLLNEEDTKIMIVKVMDVAGMPLLTDNLTEEELNGVFEVISKKD